MAQTELPVWRCHCGHILRAAWFKFSDDESRPILYRSWKDMSHDDDYQEGLCCTSCSYFEF